MKFIKTMWEEDGVYNEGILFAEIREIKYA